MLRRKQRNLTNLGAKLFVTSLALILLATALFAFGEGSINFIISSGTSLYATLEATAGFFCLVLAFLAIRTIPNFNLIEIEAKRRLK